MIHTPDGILKPGDVAFYLCPNRDEGTILTVTVSDVAKDRSAVVHDRYFVVIESKLLDTFVLPLVPSYGEFRCYEPLFSTSDGAHMERLKRRALRIRDAEAVLSECMRDTDGGPVG